MNYEEGVKHSMSLPWTPHPLYSTRAQDTTPKSVRKERRKRKLMRFFWHLRDDINLAIIMLAMFGGGVIFWLTVAQVEKWLR